MDVNAYTTKHCPTMGGVLEELRRGLERLDEQRAAEQARLESALAAGQLSEEERRALKRKSAFSETMRTLNRLSSLTGAVIGRAAPRCYSRSCSGT